MKDKLIQGLTSKTVWVLVFAFIFNGFQSISGAFIPEVTLSVNAILTVLAMIFKLNPSQKY